MSEKVIENVTASDKHFAPKTFIDTRPLPDVKFNGYCIIDKLLDSRKAINLYISYILDPWSRDLNTNFRLSNSLLGPLKLTMISDPGKYSEFSLTDGSMGKIVIIFGADVSSSVLIGNKNKDILFFGEGPTQGLYDTTLKAEAKYSISFTQLGKRFVSCL